MDVRGQHILVTGASRGIGAAIARSLLERGARLAIHCNRSRDQAEALMSDFPDSGSVVLSADLEVADEVESLFRESLERLGHLDALILNAGVFLPHPPETSPENWYTVWRKTMSVNLDAPGMLTKLALDHFMERSGGRLVYIGSRAAFRGETASYLAYGASKGGLTSLARSVARSYGRFNIKAFTIAPGFTRTEMAEAFIAENGEQQLLDEIALPELTLPKDIAPLVVFICTGGMDHATGTTIDINAGSYMH